VNKGAPKARSIKKRATPPEINETLLRLRRRQAIWRGLRWIIATGARWSETKAGSSLVTPEISVPMGSENSGKSGFCTDENY